MNRQNAQSNDKEKEIHFIILVPSEEKLNLKFTFSSEIAPQIFYKKSIEKGNGSFIEHNVFKLKVIQNEKKERDKTEKKDMKITIKLSV